MDGPVHRGEIHAAAVHDRVGRTPDIGPDELRLLDRSYQDWIMVDEAIAHVGDRSLTAEVMRWRGLQKRMKAAQESIRQVEDRCLRWRWINGHAAHGWKRRGRFIGLKKR
jgi:hypothetical protein